MKVKIEITYKLDEIPKNSSMENVDKILVKYIESLMSGKFYSEGVDVEGTKNISFNLEIINEPLLRIKQ